MQIDISQDYLFYDNLEPVTYTFKNPSGSDVPVAVSAALRADLTRKEIEYSNGAYCGLDIVWFLPDTLLRLQPGPNDLTPQPKPRDTVQDPAGTTWTVLESGLINLGSSRGEWRLVCRDPIIVYELRDLVNIEQPTITYDAAGAPVRTWAAIYTALACRVQPESADIADERGVRGQSTRYTVYLSQGVTVDVRECRVNWNGKLLDVVSYQDAERIDLLPFLTCELRP
jgi:hypothetical protein